MEESQEQCPSHRCWATIWSKKDPTFTAHLPAHDLFWVNFIVQHHFLLLISPGPCNLRVQHHLPPVDLAWSLWVTHRCVCVCVCVCVCEHMQRENSPGLYRTRKLKYSMGCAMAYSFIFLHCLCFVKFIVYACRKLAKYDIYMVTVCLFFFYTFTCSSIILIWLKSETKPSCDSVRHLQRLPWMYCFGQPDRQQYLQSRNCWGAWGRPTYWYKGQRSRKY